MRIRPRGCLLAWLMVASLAAPLWAQAPTPAAAPAPGVAAPEIAHDPLKCLDPKTFPQVDAQVTASAANVERTRVYFKAHQFPDWYYVDMTPNELVKYRALLPQPLPGTQFIDYYVYAIDAQFQPGQTPQYMPPVDEGCDRKGAYLPGDKAPELTLGGTREGQLALPPGFSSRGIVRFITASGTSISGAGLSGGVAGGGGVSLVTIGLIGGGAAAAGTVIAVTGGDDPPVTTQAPIVVAPPTTTPATTVPPTTTTLPPAPPPTAAPTPAPSATPRPPRPTPEPTPEPTPTPVTCPQGAPPLPTWRNPTAGESIAGVVNLRCRTGIKDACVAKVLYSVCDSTGSCTSIGSSGTAPFSLPFDSRTLPNGSATFQCITSALNGQNSPAASVDVQVAQPRPGPPTGQDPSQVQMKAQLDVPEARAQVVVNGASAFYPAAGASTIKAAALRTNRIEATLVTAAGGGLWRFDFGAEAAGTLQVIAGETVARTASSVTFRLAGKPGERVVFTFTAADSR